MNYGTGVDNYITYTINDNEPGSLSSGWMANVIPQWPYWLRTSDEDKTLTFTNVTMIPSNTPMSGSYPGTTQWYEYGYVCNSNPTDETNSSFDIGWAVDKKGNPVKLPGVDFIKVQTATLQYLGDFYGPACTQLNCAIDLHLKGTEIETIAQ